MSIMLFMNVKFLFGGKFWKINKPGDLHLNSSMFFTMARRVKFLNNHNLDVKILTLKFPNVRIFYFQLFQIFVFPIFSDFALACQTHSAFSHLNNELI